MLHAALTPGFAGDAADPVAGSSSGNRRISTQYPRPATVPTTAHVPHSHYVPNPSMIPPAISGATRLATGQADA
ncbi:hypothetical protein GCM10010307_35130 [Streptomyces vastus]|uniref:Uncharacterized protein n=1 Tax=Streptomyces vastus TaxID=285451 RepID=A0ABN3QWZ7_9ACTN